MSSERLERWLDPKGLPIVAAALFMVDGLGLLNDAVAAGLFAFWVAAVTAHFVYAGASARLHRLLRACLIAATAALVLVPVALTLRPGAALLDARLAEGQSVSLPAGIEGPVRVMVHADIAGTGAAGVDYRISGLGEPVRGHLERSMGKARVGKRRVAEAHVHDTDLVSASVGPGGDLAVDVSRGATAGPLHIVLFREWWSLGRQLVLGSVLLLAVALASLRGAVGEHTLPLVVGVTCFGALAYRWLTPGFSFRPEVGALVVAGFSAALVSVPWRWLLQRRGALAT